MYAARPALGPGAEMGQGPWPLGGRRPVGAWHWGRSLGACRLAEYSTAGRDPQRSAVPAVGTGAAGAQSGTSGWAGSPLSPRR